MKIAFGHKMRSGKDTAVDYLISVYGGERISFAKPLYDIMHYAQSRLGIETHKDRKFLLMCGKWGRSINEDIFVDCAITESKKKEGNIFISDVRFLNEFYKLKNDGWILVKINRSNTDQSFDISETELDNVNKDWDYIVDNNGTLNEFYDKLDIIIQSHLDSNSAVVHL